MNLNFMKNTNRGAVYFSKWRLSTVPWNGCKLCELQCTTSSYTRKLCKTTFLYAIKSLHHNKPSYFLLGRFRRNKNILLYTIIPKLTIIWIWTIFLLSIFEYRLYLINCHWMNLCTDIGLRHLLPPHRAKTCRSCLLTMGSSWYLPAFPLRCDFRKIPLPWNAGSLFPTDEPRGASSGMNIRSSADPLLKKRGRMRTWTGNWTSVISHRKHRTWLPVTFSNKLK